MLNTGPAERSRRTPLRAPGIVETVRFFAVGTNMDEERLRKWIPSAERLGIASLSAFSVEMAQAKL